MWIFGIDLLKSFGEIMLEHNYKLMMQASKHHKKPKKVDVISLIAIGTICLEHFEIILNQNPRRLINQS